LRFELFDLFIYILFIFEFALCHHLLNITNALCDISEMRQFFLFLYKWSQIYEIGSHFILVQLFRI